MEINASNYWEECFIVATDATPTFLQCVFGWILLAGKSMHLIESIGKLKHIQEGVVHSSPSKWCVVSPRDVNWGMATPNSPTDLYQDFLKSLALLGPPVESCDMSRSCDMSGSHDPDDSGAGWKVTGLDHYDHLMNSYLNLIKTNSTPHRPPDRWGTRDVSLPDSSLVPLNQLIQDNLCPLLQQHYKTVSCSASVLHNVI